MTKYKTRLTEKIRKIITISAILFVSLFSWVSISISTAQQAQAATVSITSPANGATISSGQQVVGTATANITVTIKVDGSSVGTTSADGGGNWSFTLGQIADGAHTLTAEVGDDETFSVFYFTSTGSNANSISTIEPSDLSVTGTSEGAGILAGAGYLESIDGATIYGGTNNGLFELDRASSNMEYFTAGDSNGGMALNSAGTLIYTASGQGGSTVRVFNTANHSFDAVITVGASPYSPILSPDNSTLYVINRTDSTISVIDTVSNTVTNTITLSQTPSIDTTARVVAINSSGTRLYVNTSNPCRVSVVDLNLESELTNFAVSGSGPCSSLTISTDDSQLYLSYGNNIYVVDLATELVDDTFTITAGRLISDMILASSGNQIYLLNYDTNLVSRITIISAVNGATQSESTINIAGAQQLSTNSAQSRIYTTAVSITAGAAQDGGRLNIYITSSGVNTNIYGKIYGSASKNLDKTKLYVANLRGGTVDVYNAADATLITRIILPQSASGLSVWTNPSNGKIFASYYAYAPLTDPDPFLGYVAVINSASDTITNTISLGVVTGVGFVSPDAAATSLNKLYLANTIPTKVINYSTESYVGELAGSSTGSIVINSSLNRAYKISGTSVQVWDTTTDTLVTSVTPGGSLSNIAINADGSKVYVSRTSANLVAAISTASNTVVANISAGNGPTLLYSSPDQNRIYVAHSSLSNLGVIDTNTDTNVATITTPTSNQVVVLSSDESILYVMGGLSSSLVKIDASTGTQLDSVVLPGGLSLFTSATKLSQVINSSTISVNVSNPTNPVTPTTPTSPTTPTTPTTPATPSTSAESTTENTDAPIPTPSDRSFSFNQTEPLRRVAGEVGNWFDNILARLRFGPDMLKWIFPWLLLIMLLILSVRLLWQAKREIDLTTQLQDELARRSVVGQQIDNLLSLVSHYFNTPLAIITSGLGGMAVTQKGDGSVVNTSYLSAITQKLGMHISALVERVRMASSSYKSSNAQATELATPNPYRAPQVIVPIVLVVGLYLTILWVLSRAGDFTLSNLTILAQVVLFAICAQVLVSSFRYSKLSSAHHNAALLSLNATRDLDNSRATIVRSATESIDHDLYDLKLRAAQNNLHLSPSVAEGISRLEALIARLELLGEVSVNATKLPMEEINFGEFIDELISDYKGQLDARSINISKDIAPGVTLHGNKQLIGVLIGSVIDNAVKFAPKANGQINISAQQHRKAVEIKVMDNGVGIEKDKIDSLMKPFSRATSVTEYNYSGAGLGLYLDKLILDQINGTLHISSQPGKGTTVSVRIVNKTT